MDKDYYKEHRRNSVNNWAYSIQRIDLLIVSISGAGIYIVLETLKYSIENNLPYSCALKICGSIFVLALILNFISQCTGQSANDNEIKFADEKLDDKEDTAKIFAKIADRYSGYTHVLNISSMIAMFIALITLVVYFFITF